MRAFLYGILLGAAACAAPRSPAVPPRGVWSLRVLGAAQDGGVPQLGCTAAVCVQAHRHRVPADRVAALAVVAPDGRWWLIDATPDLPAQVGAMGRLPEAILLTHAHIGHYTGLMFLGREAADTRGMPVRCSPAMADFLRGNAPWSQLVKLGEIELRPFQSGKPFELAAGLTVTPWEVPHRNEFADTHAFRIEREGGLSVLYLPDIDRWEPWDRDLAQVARGTDLLFLDGTFFSDAELPGRDRSTIPHPDVTETMDLLEEVVAATGNRVVFTHLNHTNPLWIPGSRANAELRRRGFTTAIRETVFPLAPPRPAKARW